MNLIRSILFTLAQTVFTLSYALFSPFIFPFGQHMRHRLLSGFAPGLLWLLKVICGIRMEVRGLENIPEQACVVLSKHQSAWETLALQLVLPAHAWVAKRELLWIPFFGWLLALSSPIALDRSKGKAAMKELLKKGKEKLEQGFCIVLFPEGTRIPFGQRGKYKIGGALLASHAGVPVLPVAHNAGKFWGRNAFIKKPGTIVMVIGPVIDTTRLKAEEINSRTEAWIEGEMTRLG
ncbi:MAG: 1-acyl-sn-glycerol-3-phosphate acyltransferase [Gammaproteobacteria bacterium]|nr:1-acyl-sn-glycerol-3-phosphate acyltransferase [Gammaproteobacteria bacterium]MBU1623476.1 1-acyl-sn-glycerol-3-phosphate acyltransferase [Gammaproteobacteria bacterium]MBU1982315.1 1-acyl-sn-glycerol-3-phosphate acyltransferase [Gammaproteobacteria bacterium]